MRNELLFSTLMSSDNGMKEVNVSIMTSGTCLQAVETRNPEMSDQFMMATDAFG
jgi:hypothetical protein